MKAEAENYWRRLSRKAAIRWSFMLISDLFSGHLGGENKCQLTTLKKTHSHLETPAVSINQFAHGAPIVAHPFPGNLQICAVCTYWLSAKCDSLRGTRLPLLGMGCSY